MTPQDYSRLPQSSAVRPNSAIDWSEIRSHFPALANRCYLNTAGGCAMPIEVGKAGSSYYEESVSEGDACWKRWLERTEVVRSQLATTLNVNSDSIAFLGNASLGMNYVQQLLGADKHVLLIAGDFPSVTLPWVHRTNKVTFLNTNPDGSVSDAQIKAAIDQGVDALVLGHVQYNSGFRFELDAISDLCKHRGVSLIVDATQSFGARHIDLKATPVDALLFSGYKWSLAGYGIGSIYLSEEFRSKRETPVIGWRSAEVPYKMLFDQATFSGAAQDFELGHPPFAAIFALGAALDFTTAIGIARIEARIRELTLYLHAKADAAGISIASTRSPSNLSGITMIRVSDPDSIVRELGEKGIFVSNRNGLVRVSLHFYNLESDIDRLIEALSGART